jgi:LuxR family maltose regulon positive regulatory protein
VSDLLLSTKLGPSQSRPTLVARPRLTAKLGRVAGRKLTVVSAPAGFGKTTLLVEWLGSPVGSGGSVAWVSLDAGDNDPVRFLSYLVAALNREEGEIGNGVLALLRSPQPAGTEAITGLLVNDLAALPGEISLGDGAAATGGKRDPGRIGPPGTGKPLPFTGGRRVATQAASHRGPA